MSTPSPTSESTQALGALPGGTAWLALKRALLGIVLLCAFVSAGAWLMYASIEADADTDTPPAAVEQASGVANPGVHK